LKVDRKQNILDTALRLFADEGFTPVTTSRLAKEAEVSEGLIFKHFKNKQDIFDKLIELTDQKLFEALMPILDAEKPKEVLRLLIDMPHSISEKEYGFWRFHFKIKWDENYDALEKIKPLMEKLEWAFTELKYKQPEIEAEIFMNISESISTGILRDGKSSSTAMSKLLLKKYKLS